MPSRQAEVQAKVLIEAFNVNLQELVTKDYLESQLAARFAEQKADFEVRFRVQTVMMSLILAAVVLPYLERLVLI